MTKVPSVSGNASRFSRVLGLGVSKRALIVVSVVSLLTACSTPTDLSVSVVDEGGSPIAGAAVTVEAGESTGGDLLSTDASGTATWSGLSGEGASVSVEADGYFPESIEAPLESGLNEYSVTLSVIAFDVSVSVMDADGSPVEGATVAIGSATGVSDGSGTVTWSDLPGSSATEPVSLTVEADGYFPESTEGTLVRGENQLTVALVLMPYDLTVSITNQEGDAIEGANVALLEAGEPAVTDATGDLSWFDLPHDLATVTATAQGYHPIESALELFRGENQATVALERDPFGILPGEACPGGATPLLIEDFQDGEAQGWSVEAGWTIGIDPNDPGNVVFVAAPDPDGPEPAFNQPAGAHAALLLFDVANGVIRAEMRTDTGFVAPGVGRSTFQRYIDADGNQIEWSGYSFSINNTEIYMWRNDFTPGEVDVFHTSFGNSPVDWPRIGEWMTVEWVIQDGALEVWIDGEQALAAVDPDPLGPGRVGFGTSLYSAEARLILDNVVICEVNGPFESMFGMP